MTALTHDIRQILEWKYGPRDDWAWGPRLRAKFDYVTPADVYEAVVFDHVKDGTKWLDVGCGRQIFPSNPRTAEVLSKKCALLFGIDPDINIHDNELVHGREQTIIENFHSNTEFDLITLRMVAEHIVEPEKTADSIFRLLKPGGRVIIHTVSKWAPVSILAAVTPTRLHHIVKSILWRTEERDTFPVAYRMNTHPALSALFRLENFEEIQFQYLDDCRIFARWKSLNFLELGFRSLLRVLGVPYPERCILVIYQKR